MNPQSLQQFRGQVDSTMHQFIKAHYDHNMYTNTYKCKYCGLVDSIKYSERSNNLYLHVYQIHRNMISENLIKPINSNNQQMSVPKVVIDKNKISNGYQKSPRYNYEVNQAEYSRNKAEEAKQEQFSDEWLERLAISGFPIRDILATIFMRHRQNGHGFQIYLENKAMRLKDNIEKIKKYINNKIPVLSHPNEVGDEIVQKFRITPYGAKLTIEDFMLIYRKDYEVTDQLRRRGMTIFRYEEERINTVVFFCDDVMKTNFSRYGDCVFVNFRPCQIKRYGENRKILVGTFTGQTASIKHVLFGACLILGQSVKNYRILLKYFMRAMRIQTLPPSFIVTESQNLIRAISTLSENAPYNVQKVESWYHLQQQLKKSLSFDEQDDREALIKKYMNMLTTLNPQQASILINQFTKKRTSANQTFQYFFQQNKRNLIAYKIPTFVGFGVERQYGNIINHISSRYLGSHQTLGFFYIQSMKMFQQKMDFRMKETELIRFQQFKAFDIPLSDELRYLSIRIQKPVFIKLLVMYRIAMKQIKIISKNQVGLIYQLTPKPQNISDKIIKSLVFTVKYSLKDQCWRCNCNQLYWSGLPCSHLIKIIRAFRGSLTYYINKRWFIMNQRFNPDKLHHPQEAKMEPQYDQDFQQITDSNMVKNQEIQEGLIYDDNNIVVIDQQSINDEQADSEEYDKNKQLHNQGHIQEEQIQNNEIKIGQLKMVINNQLQNPPISAYIPQSIVNPQIIQIQIQKEAEIREENNEVNVSQIEDKEQEQIKQSQSKIMKQNENQIV